MHLLDPFLVTVETAQTKQALPLDKKLFLRGQHSSMVNGLQGRYPIYGPIVRWVRKISSGNTHWIIPFQLIYSFASLWSLAKRWVASHLFSFFLAEEAVELLVAYLFVKPFPFYAPCSRIAGFLRYAPYFSLWLFMSQSVMWAWTPWCPSWCMKTKGGTSIERYGYVSGQDKISNRSNDLWPWFSVSQSNSYTLWKFIVINPTMGKSWCCRYMCASHVFILPEHLVCILKSAPASCW